MKSISYLPFLFFFLHRYIIRLLIVRMSKSKFKMYLSYKLPICERTDLILEHHIPTVRGDINKNHQMFTAKTSVLGNVGI